MATRAQIIDATFKGWNRYPAVPFEPIGEMVVDEVERMGKDGLYLSTACALIEQESGGKNIFGCDWGSQWTVVPPYCNVAVTKERVQKLIQNVHKGGGQNGVGLTQLTSIGYVQEAEKMGGAHKMRFQCRVGFRVLNDEIAALGWPQGAAAYNAGRGNWAAVMATYGASMSRKQKEWAARLDKASDKPGKSKPASAPEKKPPSITTGKPGGGGSSKPQPKDDGRAPWQKGDCVPPNFHPKPVSSGGYVAQHPTRFFWREDVLGMVRRIYRRWPHDTFVNTYVGHPPGWEQYERVSLDVWGARGRGYQLNPDLGDDIWRFLFNFEKKPDWQWGIYKGRMWSQGGGWEASPWGPPDSDPGHWNHIHISYDLTQ